MNMDSQTVKTNYKMLEDTAWNELFERFNQARSTYGPFFGELLFTKTVERSYRSHFLPNFNDRPATQNHNLIIQTADTDVLRLTLHNIINSYTEPKSIRVISSDPTERFPFIEGDKSDSKKAYAVFVEDDSLNFVEYGSKEFKRSYLRKGTFAEPHSLFSLVTSDFLSKVSKDTYGYPIEVRHDIFEKEKGKDITQDPKYSTSYISSLHRAISPSTAGSDMVYFASDVSFIRQPRGNLTFAKSIVGPQTGLLPSTVRFIYEPNSGSCAVFITKQKGEKR